MTASERAGCDDVTPQFRSLLADFITHILSYKLGWRGFLADDNKKKSNNKNNFSTRYTIPQWHIHLHDAATFTGVSVTVAEWCDGRSV